MLSVKKITNSVIKVILILCCGYIQTYAQENSPFSRYGLGDFYPIQNIAERGMGGISQGYANEQALNTSNPASYSSLKYVNLFGGSHGGLVTYDFGLSIDSRTLRSATPSESYRSTNFLPSYIQIGIPLSAKAEAKKRNAGLVFGLRPYTRINYSVQSNTRIDIDSIENLYEGSGGLNQVFMGLGKRWNNFSIGFNAGYEFGRKDISSKVIFINDSINFYKSNSTAKTTFWGLFLNPGISYNIKLNEVKGKTAGFSDAYFLRLGASGMLEQKLNATTDNRSETFAYDANTGTNAIDSIYQSLDNTGNVSIPMTYSAGFVLSKKYMRGDVALATKWSVGADYSAGKWTDYRFYNKPDQLVNSWMIHAGGEFIPSLLSTSLFSRATYRLGFYTGKDYINADGNGYNVKAATFGFGFYLKRYSSYDNQSTLINTAIEFGKRGTNVNNVTENFFKLSLGLSLADLWFTRRKYD